MWNRSGARSEALERAKAQLSGIRVTTSRTSNQQRPRTSSPGVSFGDLLQSRQSPQQDLSALSSDTESEKQINQTHPAQMVLHSAESPEQSSLGGRNRFLKKPSNNGRPSTGRTDTSDLRLISQRGSQSVALSRLTAIEDRIRTRKNNMGGKETTTESESGHSVQSSSELSAAGGSRFLKNKSFSNESNLVETYGRPFTAPVRTATLVKKQTSLDSDEEDMRKLLGESPLDSPDGINDIKQAEMRTRPAVKTSRESREQAVTFIAKHEEKLPVSSAFTAKVHRVQTPSPSTPSSSRSFSQRVEHSERSASSASRHSEIRSLEDLFPDTQSERSESDDFKMNILTLDDLAPVSLGGVEKTKATPPMFRKLSGPSADVLSQEHSLKAEEDSTLYQSDFESEIQTEMDQSVDQISEHLSDGPESSSAAAQPQSGSPSAKSQTDHDESLSEKCFILRSESKLEASLGYSRSSDTTTYSSDATITHTEPRPRKDATVQTQGDGLTYTWSLGQAALDPSVGMTYVDPTPVASHTISAEAVEALTAYSPAVFALNDMLRQQLALTRSFIQSSRYLHQTMLDTLEPADYRYTTLENTKEFIRCNRLPRLTMEDALEKVLQEMRDYHYI